MYGHVNIKQEITPGGQTNPLFFSPEVVKQNSKD